jgi:hypothetical protein
MSNSNIHPPFSQQKNVSNKPSTHSINYSSILDSQISHKKSTDQNENSPIKVDNDYKYSPANDSKTIREGELSLIRIGQSNLHHYPTHHAVESADIGSNPEKKSSREVVNAVTSTRDSAVMDDSVVDFSPDRGISKLKHDIFGTVKKP